MYVSTHIPLLHLTLYKVRGEERDVIAILPWWPNRGCFPLVLSLLVKLLVLLSDRPDDFKESSGESPSRPLDPPISCLAALADIFQAIGVSEAAAHTICPHWRLHDICTMSSGRTYYTGARNRVLFPFTLLLIRWWAT